MMRGGNDDVEVGKEEVDDPILMPFTDKYN